MALALAADLRHRIALPWPSGAYMRTPRTLRVKCESTSKSSVASFENAGCAHARAGFGFGVEDADAGAVP
jgi:hypothetical protein